MSLTVTIREFPPHIVPEATTWLIDGDGYLKVFSIDSDEIATFAPGWTSVVSNDADGATP